MRQKTTDIAAMKGPNPRNVENPNLRSSLARAGNPSRPVPSESRSVVVVDRERERKREGRETERERDADAHLRPVTRATAPIDPLRPPRVESIDRVQIAAARSRSPRRVRTGSKTRSKTTTTTPRPPRVSWRAPRRTSSRDSPPTLRPRSTRRRRRRQREWRTMDRSRARSRRARDAASAT